MKTLKYEVVEPSVVKTVSKVSVSVLNDMLPIPPDPLLQLLKNNNTSEQLNTKMNLKAFNTITTID